MAGIPCFFFAANVRFEADCLGLMHPLTHRVNDLLLNLGLRAKTRKPADIALRAKQVICRLAYWASNYVMRVNQSA
jgi:hypothetical protein